MTLWCLEEWTGSTGKWSSISITSIPILVPSFVNSKYGKRNRVSTRFRSLDVWLFWFPPISSVGSESSLKQLTRVSSLIDVLFDRFLSCLLFRAKIWEFLAAALLMSPLHTKLVSFFAARVWHPAAMFQKVLAPKQKIEKCSSSLGFLVCFKDIS